MNRFAIVLVFFCALPAWPDVMEPQPSYYKEAREWLAAELYDIPEEERIQGVRKLLKDVERELGQEYAREHARGRLRRGAFLNSPLEYRIELMEAWLRQHDIGLAEGDQSRRNLRPRGRDINVELDFDAAAWSRGYYMPPAYLNRSVATKEDATTIKARRERIAESAAKARALAAEVDKVGEKSEDKTRQEDAKPTPTLSKVGDEQGADPKPEAPGHSEEGLPSNSSKESSSSNRPGVMIAGVLLLLAALLGLRRLLAAQ